MGLSVPAKIQTVLPTNLPMEARKAFGISIDSTLAFIIDDDEMVLGRSEWICAISGTTEYVILSGPRECVSGRLECWASYIAVQVSLQSWRRVPQELQFHRARRGYTDLFG